MKHINIFIAIFIIQNAFIIDANSQGKNRDSSKISITNIVQSPPANESTSEASWNKLVYLCVGAFLALIGGVMRDIFIDRRDKKRIRQAIIAEIERNSTYGVDEKDNMIFTFPKMWFTKMFDGNIGKISYFNKNEIAHLIDIYSWMHGFRELFLDIEKKDRDAETIEHMRNQANAIRTLCRNFIKNHKIK